LKLGFSQQLEQTKSRTIAAFAAIIEKIWRAKDRILNSSDSEQCMTQTQHHLTNYFSALDTLLAAGDSRVRALYRVYTTPV